MVESAYVTTRDLILAHKDQVELVARRLLEKEILQREDMVELLGKRPFAEKSTYEEITRGTFGAAPPTAAAPEVPGSPTPAPAV